MVMNSLKKKINSLKNNTFLSVMGEIEQVSEDVDGHQGGDYLCQELFKSIWSHLHVQLSRTQQFAGVTDL